MRVSDRSERLFVCWCFSDWGRGREDWNLLYILDPACGDFVQFKASVRTGLALSSVV